MFRFALSLCLICVASLALADHPFDQVTSNTNQRKELPKVLPQTVVVKVSKQNGEVEVLHSQEALKQNAESLEKILSEESQFQKLGVNKVQEGDENGNVKETNAAIRDLNEISSASSWYFYYRYNYSYAYPYYSYNYSYYYYNPCYYYGGYYYNYNYYYGWNNSYYYYYYYRY